MKLKITQPYLWLPVKKDAQSMRLHFWVEGKKIDEADICLGGADCDFYACREVEAYLGCEMVIDGADDSCLTAIFCHGERPQNVYPFRPQIHFAPPVGWHNDPNGLVYQEGCYQLYYQHNPYGTGWGNMQWGHSVSRDLIHWEHLPVAMRPDETGTVYSGCGMLDERDLTGHGEGAMLFYYTAAGGRNEWSRSAGNKFTQRLAWTADGGRTLVRDDRFVMEHIAGENRDPKIFYHEESGAYVMALYLDGNEFALYRSQDLLHWEETQRMEYPGMWECPDLFRLPVEDGDGESRWIFWSADGYYLTGSFDGYRFQPDSEVIKGYATPLPYAAQTYSNTGARVISVAWLRMKNTRGNYCGLMSMPCELSLKRRPEGPRIAFAPVRELQSAAGAEEALPEGCRMQRISLDNQAAMIRLEWKKPGRGQTRVRIRDVEMVADFTVGTLDFVRTADGANLSHVTLAQAENYAVELLIDQEVLEFFAEDKTVYGALELGENVLGAQVELDSEIPVDRCVYRRFPRDDR